MSKLCYDTVRRRCYRRFLKLVLKINDITTVFFDQTENDARCSRGMNPGFVCLEASYIYPSPLVITIEV